MEQAVPVVHLKSAIVRLDGVNEPFYVECVFFLRPPRADTHTHIIKRCNDLFSLSLHRLAVNEVHKEMQRADSSHDVSEEMVLPF